jgi:hypothetical protein
MILVQHEGAVDHGSCPLLASSLFYRNRRPAIARLSFLRRGTPQHMLLFGAPPIPCFTY